ncbi:MAG TPA: hypothetical protein VFD32_04025 [Dehalococcoidia bacterium]|nr:hypothetical protein [Dehalococcoidia bacterium]
MSANGPPHDILIAPEDERRSARMAVLGFCTSLGLAAIVALIAWHSFMGAATAPENRALAPAGAVPVAATTASGSSVSPAGKPPDQPAAPAAASAPATSMMQADVHTVAPDLTLQALAEIDPQAPTGTLTVFVVDTAKEAADLEQGLLATNAFRATGGAAPLRATAVSAADPQAFWLALVQSENEPYTVVDLRQP